MANADMNSTGLREHASILSSSPRTRRQRCGHDSNENRTSHSRTAWPKAPLKKEAGHGHHYPHPPPPTVINPPQKKVQPCKKALGNIATPIHALFERGNQNRQIKQSFSGNCEIVQFIRATAWPQTSPRRLRTKSCSRTCLLGGQALESCKIETPKSSKERLTPNWRVACGTPSTPIEWLLAYLARER